MRAVESRDPRFDGWVTVGVTSTGIYCRPSCPTPVRPKRANMAFFATPASAQAAGFRACKRCAPDATPGSPEWNRRDDLVARAIRAIEDGHVDRHGVDGLALHLAVSPRHLHRLLVSEVGATPLGLARARRARAARTLIESTDLPFSDLAFAAGFDSIRQFNDTVKDVFALTPTELRRSRRSPGHRGAESSSDGRDRLGLAPATLDLRLALRPPIELDAVVAWLDSHAVPGVESVVDGWYRRALRLPSGPGVIEVDLNSLDRSNRPGLDARFRLAALGDLQTAIQRTRRVFDLDADPARIDADLSSDADLAALVALRSGMRAPGDADGFEAALRAIVHQQVSVAAARTTLGRIAERHGSALGESVAPSADDGIVRLLPAAEALAAVEPESLGMPRARARSLVALAAAVAEGDIDLSPLADRDETAERLLALPGIGPWTASIVRLRGLGDPDVFVSSDLAVRRVAAALGMASTDRELDARAAAWSPWRSYALHHLWAAYRSDPRLKETSS